MTTKKRVKDLCPVDTRINPETLVQLDKAAASRNLSRSELLRQYIMEGLKVKSYEDNFDKLAKLIRQEIRKEISLDDIRTIVTNNADRIVEVVIRGNESRKEKSQNE